MQTLLTHASTHLKPQPPHSSALGSAGWKPALESSCGASCCSLLPPLLLTALPQPEPPAPRLPLQLPPCSAPPSAPPGPAGCGARWASGPRLHSKKAEARRRPSSAAGQAEGGDEGGRASWDCMQACSAGAHLTAGSEPARRAPSRVPAAPTAAGGLPGRAARRGTTSASASTWCAANAWDGRRSGGGASAVCARVASQ